MGSLSSIVLVAGIPIVIGAMLTFDSLVLIERERFPEVWASDGMPIPFYRARHEFARTVSAGMASNKLSLLWLFSTPPWVRSDADAARLLRRMRILAAIWNFAFVPLFIFVSFWRR
jgi:hypothetical protein